MAVPMVAASCSGSGQANPIDRSSYDRSAGTAVSTTTTLPPGVTIPSSTRPSPGNCAFGILALTQSAPRDQLDVCVHVGTLLRVTFESAGINPVLSAVGTCNPCVNDASILTVTSRYAHGYVLIAYLRALRPGSAYVDAIWIDPNTESSPPTSTPTPYYAVAVTVVP